MILWRRYNKTMHPAQLLRASGVVRFGDGFRLFNAFSIVPPLRVIERYVQKYELSATCNER